MPNPAQQDHYVFVDLNTLVYLKKRITRESLVLNIFFVFLVFSLAYNKVRPKKTEEQQQRFSILLSHAMTTYIPS